MQLYVCICICTWHVHGLRSIHAHLCVGLGCRMLMPVSWARGENTQACVVLEVGPLMQGGMEDAQAQPLALVCSDPLYGGQ